MKKIFALLLMAVTVLAGCGSGGGGNSNKTLSSIAVTPVNNRLAVNKSLQFTATGTYSDGTTQNLTASVAWSSSSSAVATVSSTGMVTAKAAGSTTIKAASGGISDSTSLTVPSVTLVAISISHANQSIAVGTSEQFTATGTYSDNTTKDLTSSVSWNSSDTTVADIDANGKATAKAAGSTDITATSGTISSLKAALTVKTATLNSIAVTPASPTIPKNAALQFTATGTFSDSSTQDLTASVTWNSSDQTFATIDANGKATAVSDGTTNITATMGAVQGTTVLTVQTPPQSIVVTPANPTVAAGATRQFTATGTFLDGANTPYQQDLTASATWSSSDTTVATIDADGKATAVSSGTTTITAAAGGISASTTLTVTPLNVSGTWTGTYTIYDDPSEPDQLGTYNFEFVLSQIGTAVTGTATLRGNTSGQLSATAPISGQVTGRQLNFSFTYPSPRTPENIMVDIGTADIADNAITGNVIENFQGGYYCSYILNLTKQP